jgi:hypothetical protein
LAENALFDRTDGCEVFDLRAADASDSAETVMILGPISRRRE